MKLGFIFVLFNTPQHETTRLKTEVRKLGFKNYKIYFIDNSDINLGYAGGVNIGIQKGLKDGVDIFVIANPDISFGKVIGKNILESAKKFDIWGLAFRQEGKIFYGGEVDKWRMSGGLVDKKPASKLSSVDFVSGSLMFIKREVIEKIGLFDESYFLYYEEVDYCQRAHINGFKIGVDSSLVYDHFELSKSNPEKEFYLFKNRLKFLFKYGTLKQKLREILRSPKTIIEEVIKRPFYLNFFSLNISSVISKILNFILFLILVRYFEPAQYAIYTLAWAHVGLFLPLLDFGTTSYGLVYLPNQKEKQAIKLFSFRIILATLTFLITVLLALIFRYPPNILIPIFLISVVIFANCFSGSFLIFASIIQKSYMVSLVSMIFQITMVISLILGVIITTKLMTVFIISFVLYLAYSLVNFFLIRTQIKNLHFEFDPKAYISIAKKSFVFLLISLFAGFYSKVDVFLLNFLKGAKAVGQYSAGYKFLDALLFVTTAYNVSAMPIFSRLAKQSKKLLLLKIKKDIALLSIIGFTVATLIFFLAPVILPIILKGDYSSSIKVLQIVIFGLPLILLTSIALNVLYAMGKAKLVVYLFAFQLIYNIITNYIFIPRFGYFASSWISLVGELLNTIILFVIVRRVLYENIS